MAKSSKKAKPKGNGKRRGGKRVPDAVLAVRMGVLEDLMVSHPIWEDIVAALTAPPPNGFGVAESTLEEWRRKILNRWRLDAGQPRELLRAEHRARAGAVFRRAWNRDSEKADKVALDAAKVMAQLDGVLVNQPAAGATVNVNVMSLTPSQRQQEIAQLLAKRERALAQSRARALPVPSVIDAAATERR
jgi:hypothetical protein